MRNFITITAGLAAIAGVGFTSYQIGQSNQQEGAEAVNVTVQNSLENVISGLPPGKRDGAKEILAPILELVAAASAKGDLNDKEVVSKAANSIKETLSKISIVSYYASKSPFVPSVNKVQLSIQSRVN